MAMSIRTMAAALGISKSQVQRAHAAGMPLTDADAARAWRASNTDLSRTAEGRIDRQEPAPAPAAAPAADDDADQEAPAAGDTDAYRAARTEREQIRRDRERIELQREQGLVVDRAEGARLRFTEFRALRDNLVNLGQRLGPLVAAETDPIRCEQIYTAALAEVLTAFADGVLTRDVMQDVDEDDDEAD